MRKHPKQTEHMKAIDKLIRTGVGLLALALALSIACEPEYPEQSPDHEYDHGYVPTAKPPSVFSIKGACPVPGRPILENRTGEKWLAYFLELAGDTPGEWKPDMRTLEVVRAGDLRVIQVGRFPGDAPVFSIRMYPDSGQCRHVWQGWSPAGVN